MIRISTLFSRGQSALEGPACVHPGRQHAAQAPGGSRIDLCGEEEPVPAQPVPPTEPAAWSCSACTFLNDGHLTSSLRDV